MVRSLGFAVALAFAATGTLLPVATRAADRTAPMKFELRLQGSAEVCGAQCPILIAASGAIAAETPRDFRQFVKGRDIRNATVVFDSDGGSVLGAIALGRDIRRLGLSTTVGRVIDIVPEAARDSGKDQTRFGAIETVYATLSPRADCESMCAFVLLGGVKRMVPPEARVRVHQIWLGDRREDPTAASYSAEDMVLVQRDIGKLAQYTVEMGASVDLLDLALRIPPWEPMHAMTRAQLLATGLATGEPGLPSAPATAAITPRAPATAVQPSAPKVTSGTQATPISDRRWSVVERGGVSTLARRHPLTVEGETIGSFDLSLACSADGDSYDFSYVERRKGAADKPAPTVLSSVTLRVGRALTPLKVVASERRTETGELVSFASGLLAAQAVADFAGTGNQAMIIQTQADGVVTVIRLGNTGARQDFPQLAVGCDKTPGARAAVPTRNPGAYAAAQ